MNPEEMLWSCIPHPSQSFREHFQKRKLDIVNDPDFKEAINAIFAMCTKIKKKREGAVVNRTSIVDQIFKKKILHSTYRMSKNYKKVFADYMRYFCNRGRKNPKRTED